MKERMYEVFDRSEEHHWWFISRRRIVLDLISKFISRSGLPRILDVGCGMGGTLLQLEQLGEASGVDISPEAVKYSQGRGCRDVRLVFPGQLPFPDGSFDLVVSLDVIEHIEDDLASLKDYRRLLAPGGKLLLTVPAFSWLWSQHDDDNLHLRRYSRGGLRSVLLQAGLRPQRIFYFCCLLFPLVVVVRWLEKFFSSSKREAGAALNQVPAPINSFLTGVFSSERFWLSRYGFPWGSSLMAVCEIGEEN